MSRMPENRPIFHKDMWNYRIGGVTMHSPSKSILMRMVRTYRRLTETE